MQDYFRRLSIPIMLIALLSLSFTAAGCNGGSPRAEVSQIDQTLRAGTSQLAEVTGFIGAIKEFNFENANFLQNALNSINTSRSELQTLQASIDKLGKISYNGKLKKLGEYMQQYIEASRDGIAELGEVYDGLEQVLKAIEPALREEAVITQLNEPGNDAELLQRLKKLESALVPVINNLESVQVPNLLAAYKALFRDIFATLLKLTESLIVVASGGPKGIDLENNPDFDHMSQLIAGYSSLVEELYDGLKVSKIDAILEQVELEINRLYLGEG